MNIFETTTKELRFMHDESDLMHLEKLSNDYYCADQQINKLEKELSQALPKENVKDLSKLYDCFSAQKAITGEIFYNQGFSDGIKLIIQSLTWDSVRR
jgi:uncharacterized protein (DUF2164 family)